MKTTPGHRVQAILGKYYRPIVGQREKVWSLVVNHFTKFAIPPHAESFSFASPEGTLAFPVAQAQSQAQSQPRANPSPPHAESFSFASPEGMEVSIWLACGGSHLSRCCYGRSRRTATLLTGEGNNRDPRIPSYVAGCQNLLPLSVAVVVGTICGFPTKISTNLSIDQPLYRHRVQPCIAYGQVLHPEDVQALTREGTIIAADRPGIRRIHKRRPNRSSDEEYKDLAIPSPPSTISSPASPAPIEDFETIPDNLVSRETLLYLGFVDTAAKTIWGCWCNWGSDQGREADGGPVTFESIFRSYICISTSGWISK
jgi:hypothetical protein